MFTGIHVFIQDHQYMYTCRSKFLFGSLFYHISNIQNNKYIWAFLYPNLDSLIFLSTVHENQYSSNIHSLYDNEFIKLQSF